ncbi:MAG: glycosyltransferase family 1 protein [Acidobacteria bacterium]|nr:glycosyltransferase family 1 protein [Acidobacteriota bacterium]
MRIAILGTRGIPARYGGFETFAEELARRLVERGHDVTVYCRERHSEPSYLGVRLKTLPTIRHKYTDTLAHTAISMFHATLAGYDVVLCCNAANAIFCWWPRPFGTPVALNVDGLERLRKKWNRAAKAWYRLSEWLATFCATEAVSDAKAIQDYYLAEYGCETTFIPYGAETTKTQTTETLHSLGLAVGEYFLYVSRWEPENNALLVRAAFEEIATTKKLALIGDAPYADAYIAKVRDTNNPRIVMPGYVFGQGYKELGSHCFAYIHATEVGGTHPALIEAMGRGALVLYLETKENAEVAGGCGIPFTESTLPAAIAEALRMPAGERAALSARAVARVEERYSWDAVTSQYEALFQRLTSR